MSYGNFRQASQSMIGPHRRTTGVLPMDRLSALPDHPCLLLASPVDDEYLCAEVVRHGGFDVMPRSASQDRIIGNVRFASFSRN